jgi:hypothetical protein
MPQYKNYAGQLITCPKQEGTCWQPDHLTKEQFKLQRKHVGDFDVVYASAGEDGGSSWVSYDSYERFVDETEEFHQRPTNDPVGEKLYDMAREALGDDINIIIDIREDKNGNKPTTNGELILATAFEKNQSPLTKSKFYLDPVKYNFETVNGEVKFYKKKRFFGREEVDVRGIQRHILEARAEFNRDLSARGGM